MEGYLPWASRISSIFRLLCPRCGDPDPPSGVYNLLSHFLRKEEGAVVSDRVVGFVAWGRHCSSVRRNEEAFLPS